MYLVRMRARMSAPPPAGNGTIIVIGREALNCAEAESGQPTIEPPINRMKSRRLMTLLPNANRNS